MAEHLGERTLAQPHPDAAGTPLQQEALFEKPATGVTQPKTKDTAATHKWPNLGIHHGSYYHKNVSYLDSWTGMDAVVKLGTPTLDPTRVTADGKPVDGFSIYMGGHARGPEIDAGLSWEPTLDAHGNIDYKQPTWRPFWRNRQLKDAPYEPRFYWKPGDTVHMTLSIIGHFRMRMTIEDVANSAHRFSVDFDAPGFAPGATSTLKTVTSIDQSHREGHTVLPTASRLSDTYWMKVDLLKNKKSEPFDAEHREVVQEPAGHFQISAGQSDRPKGAEHVSIEGKQ